MKTQTFVPIKFGGNINRGTYYDVQRILNHISHVVHKEKKIPIVVFSAIGKGTKELRDIYRDIIELSNESGLDDIRERLRRFIIVKHLGLLDNLHLAFQDTELGYGMFTEREEARKNAQKLYSEMDDCVTALFRSVRMVGGQKVDIDRGFLAKMESFGERVTTEVLMIPLLKHFNYTVIHFRAEQFMSAKYKAGMDYSRAEIDDVVSTGLITERLEMDLMHLADTTRYVDFNKPIVYVVEGFIGSVHSPSGSKISTVTFGTDASDLTAMVLARSLWLLDLQSEMTSPIETLERLAERCIVGKDIIPTAILVKELDSKRPLTAITLQGLQKELRSMESSLIGEQALDYAIKHGVPIRIRQIGDYEGGQLFLPEEVPIGLRRQWV